MVLQVSVTIAYVRTSQTEYYGTHDYIT